MKRRNFIKDCCKGCLAITAIPLLLESCSSLTNITGKLIKDGLILNVDEFRIRDSKNTAYRSFVIVRNESLLYPVCVYRLKNNEYSAVWMKCSHQGAELRSSGDFLQCPAHGSEFNNKGEVTNGPASQNLRIFPVSVNGEEIFIDLRKQS